VSGRFDRETPVAEIALRRTETLNASVALLASLVLGYAAAFLPHLSHDWMWFARDGSIIGISNGF
jgi:hypothetical protein